MVEMLENLLMMIVIMILIAFIVMSWPFIQIARPIHLKRRMKYIEKNWDKLEVQQVYLFNLVDDPQGLETDITETAYAFTIPTGRPSTTGKDGTEYYIWGMTQYGECLPDLWIRRINKRETFQGGMTYIRAIKKISLLAEIYRPHAIKMPKHMQRKLQERSDEEFVYAKMTV